MILFVKYCRSIACMRADCPEDIALETLGVDGRRTTSTMDTVGKFHSEDEFNT